VAWPVRGVAKAGPAQSRCCDRDKLCGDAEWIDKYYFFKRSNNLVLI
jgi:hypothetical protein